MTPIPGNLDRRWTRWLVSLFALAAPAVFVSLNEPLIWAGIVGANGFAILLCLYFGAILLRRLQCSLLELCVVIGALGNVEGILLTTPGMLRFGPAMWALAPLAAAWILGGAVKAAVQARILGEVDPLPRVALLLLNWFTLAAPALLLAGTLLHYGRLLNDAVVSANMAAWAPLLIPIGAAGTLLSLIWEIKISRAARLVLRQSSGFRV